MIDTYLYFVPLTSGKPKHAKWKNVGSAHFLIYEQVSKTELRKADIFKSLSAAEAPPQAVRDREAAIIVPHRTATAFLWLFFMVFSFEHSSHISSEHL